MGDNAAVVDTVLSHKTATQQHVRVSPRLGEEDKRSLSNRDAQEFSGESQCYIYTIMMNTILQFQISPFQLNMTFKYCSFHLQKT